jgi:hypothetical protein
MLGKTRLLIVGSTHLGHGSDQEPDRVVAPIVERVVSWRPDAIAIEALPGELIDSYLRLGGPFADMEVGGLPQAASCAEAVRGLHDWDLWQAREVGADPNRSPDERTIAWCAAYEPYTALLHVRGARDLPPPVVEALDGVETNGGERWRVAGVAAIRLGLDRLHPFDDHADWSDSVGIPDAEYEQFMTNLSTHAQVHPLVADAGQERDEALRQGDMWPLWRRLNGPETVAASEDLESGLFVNHGSPEPLARKALAGWRTRNLLMAGRLRSVTGDYPGGRVLAIVGHSHKGPLEAALAADQWDLEIADITELDPIA